MERIDGSETSAISFVTPGNYPKENILHVCLSVVSVVCCQVVVSATG